MLNKENTGDIKCEEEKVNESNKKMEMENKVQRRQGVIYKTKKICMRRKEVYFIT